MPPCELAPENLSGTCGPRFHQRKNGPLWPVSGAGALAVIRTRDLLLRREALYPLSYEGARRIQAGRAGFEPAVEVFPRQPLSRRPQSSTLAPPPVPLYFTTNPAFAKRQGQIFAPRLTRPASGGGSGIRTHGGQSPQRFSRPPPSSTRPSLRPYCKPAAARGQEAPAAGVQANLVEVEIK